MCIYRHNNIKIVIATNEMEVMVCEAMHAILQINHILRRE